MKWKCSSKRERILLIVSGALLAAVLCFLMLNTGKFSTTQTYYDGEPTGVKEGSKNLFISSEPLSLKGNRTYEKSFVATENCLSGVGMSFKCANSDNRSGSLTATITEKDGNELNKKDLDLHELVNNKLYMISFSDGIRGGISLKKGESYNLILESKDLESDVFFSVNTSEDDHKTIYSVFMYSKIKKAVLGLCIALIIIGAVMLLIPFTIVQDAVLLRIMFLVTPILCYIAMMKVSGRSFFECIKSIMTYAGVLNLIIIIFVMTLAYLITNRTKIAIILTTLLNLLFVLANYALISFRGKPLIAADIGQWKTAAMVADSYTIELDQSAIIALVLSAVWVAVALSLRNHRGLRMRNRLILIGLWIIFGVGMYNYVFVSDSISDHGVTVSDWDPLRSYNANGYHISFVITIRHSRIEKPEGYSAEDIKAIASDYRSDIAQKAEKTTKKTPNVLVIMNESFSDLSIYGEIDTSDEVIPFFNSLKKDTVKGTLHTSILGGHTAVSEYEFLTGNSQRFVYASAIPYSSVIKGKSPSITWDFKAQKYGGNIAFHPGYAVSYNREAVYPLLGFDDHISSEDMTSPKRIRGFISDEADYERVIYEYDKYRHAEKNRPFYMFNVTIQNHGGYSLSDGEVKPHQIDVEDPELDGEETEQFLNLMKISDQQLEMLIEYFSRVKDPTVIMMYGDHQPRVSNSFYETMRERNPGKSEIEEREQSYRVPFMIWANYDIEEKDGVELSVNYLSPYLKSVIGAPMTGYQKYLLDLMKEVPVITAICTIDKNGVLTNSDDTIEQQELIDEYRKIQYNQLVDKDNQPGEFYYLREQ